MRALREFPFLFCESEFHVVRLTRLLCWTALGAGWIWILEAAAGGLCSERGGERDDGRCAPRNGRLGAGPGRAGRGGKRLENDVGARVPMVHHGLERAEQTRRDETASRGSSLQLPPLGSRTRRPELPMPGGLGVA